MINELMLEQFPNIVDVKFSAHMEEELDTIENGKTDWHEVIDDFTPISTKRSRKPK